MDELGNSRHIDQLLTAFCARHPEVECQQLKVAHLADDDGIWLFRLAGMEVQLESSTGNCPFLMESNARAKQRRITDPSQLCTAIEVELGLVKQNGQ